MLERMVLEKTVEREIRLGGVRVSVRNGMEFFGSETSKGKAGKENQMDRKRNRHAS